MKKSMSTKREARREGRDYGKATKNSGKDRWSVGKGSLC